MNEKKKLKERAGIKFIAGLTAVLMFMLCFFSGALTITCLHNNVYFDGGKTFLQNEMFELAHFAVQNLESSSQSSIIVQINGDGTASLTDYFGKPTYIVSPYENMLMEINDINGEFIGSTEKPPSEYLDRCQKLLSTEKAFLTRYPDRPAKGVRDFESVAEAETRLQDDEEYINCDKVSGALIVKTKISDIFGGGEATYTLCHIDPDDGITYTSNMELFADANIGDSFPNVLSSLEDVDLNEEYKLELKEYSSDTSSGQQNSKIIGSTIRLPFVTIDGNSNSMIYDGETIPLGTDEARSMMLEILSGDNVSSISDITKAQLLEVAKTGFCTIESIYFEGQASTIEEATYSVSVYADIAPQTFDSSYFTIRAVSDISNFRNLFPAVFIICGLLFFACVIFIVCSSGHHTGAEGISTIWFDKIPFELFAVAIAVSLWLGIAAYKFFTYDHVFTQFQNYRILEIAIGVGFVALIGIVFVAVLFTLSARLKAKCFLKYTVVGFCLRLLLRLLLKFFRLVKYLFSTLKQTWRSLLMMAAYSFVIFFGFAVAITQNDMTGLVICIVAIVSLTTLIILWSAGFEKLREYVRNIKDGELGAKIDRRFFFGNLINTADDLEGVGEGVKRAVDERMRSERLKTELITNVSHDLKTPLTSIVNYIDILSKDDIHDDTAIEHISVLQRQAARMKKLIEDLVEVSKATTGNVSVNLERTDLNLLLTQCAAEYAEKFEAAALTSVLRIPNKKIFASLDGRLMWRVFDNLLGNVCKYALAGTRVYITADDLGDHALISFKNISRHPLNVTGEDLMERFVRGDSSRNTEGSGLGLSIAKSLCDLQGVGLELIIDGDLFKVELSILKCGDDDLLEDEPLDSEDFAIIEPNCGVECDLEEKNADSLAKAEEKPNVDCEKTGE